MNTERITNKKALEYVIENHGKNIPTEILEKLENLYASLNRKSSSSGNRKPSPKQEQNVQFKTSILQFMENEPSRYFTTTEVQKTCPCFTDDVSNQKVSALLNQLVKSGDIEKTKEKGKTLFRFITK